jgi:hypothetical protein
VVLQQPHYLLPQPQLQPLQQVSQLGYNRLALHRGRKEYWEQIELATVTMRALRGEGSLDRIKRQQKHWASSFTLSDVPSEMQITSMLHNVQTA